MGHDGLRCSSRRRRTLVRQAIAVLVVATFTGQAAGASPAHLRVDPSAGARLATPAAIADQQADRFLTVRPSVGPTVVVDPTGLSLGGRRLLSSLQGLVNRKAARLYVLSTPVDATWIDEYERDGLVEVIERTDLAGALAAFAGEAAGYLVVDEQEPWTINVGTSLASLAGALIVTPEHQGQLDALGLTQLEDLRGRWPDAVSAYQALVAEHRDDLPYPGAAVLQPGDQLYDFAYQQGMAVVFTRPSEQGWDTVIGLVTSYPPGAPVYGYLSSTGIEEGIAVSELSRSGRFLVPSDTTSNLSFHVAVGRDRPRVIVAPPPTERVAPCTRDQVNVVIAISDGDNLALPTKVYREAGQWDTPERGTIPLGWSLSPSLALLAPAIWDHYARTLASGDELVPAIGMGYAAANLLPDAEGFYATSFAWDAELGMRGFWSFAAGTTRSDSPEIARIDRVAGAGIPDWLLVDYDVFGAVVTSAPTFDHTPGGRPMFVAQGFYSDTPSSLADRVRRLLDKAPADRPLVTFYSAAVWNNTAAGLVSELLPFTGNGLRLLSPSEAAACIPPAAGASVRADGGNEVLTAASPRFTG